MTKKLKIILIHCLLLVKSTMSFGQGAVPRYGEVFMTDLVRNAFQPSLYEDLWGQGVGAHSEQEILNALFDPYNRKVSDAVIQAFFDAGVIEERLVDLELNDFATDLLYCKMIWKFCQGKNWALRRVSAISFLFRNKVENLLPVKSSPFFIEKEKLETQIEETYRYLELQIETNHLAGDSPIAFMPTVSKIGFFVAKYKKLVTRKSMRKTVLLKKIYDRYHEIKVKHGETYEDVGIEAWDAKPGYPASLEELDGILTDPDTESSL